MQLHLYKIKGYEVHTVGKRSVGDEFAGVIHHQADLLDTAQMEQVISAVQADQLLHFAWFLKQGNIWHRSTT